ncbi:MAG: LolA family protein, partial [Steroidobacteraceae bacterium]
MLKMTSTAAAMVVGLWLVPALAGAAGNTPTAAVAAQGQTGAQAPSSAPTPLDRYLKNLKTLQVKFLQTVADAHGAEVGRSTGTLTVERPGKFRWDIHPQSTAAGAVAGQSAAGQAAGGTQASVPENGQLMVSDGRNLWYLDRDL